MSCIDWRPDLTLGTLTAPAVTVNLMAGIKRGDALSPVRVTSGGIVDKYSCQKGRLLKREREMKCMPMGFHEYADDTAHGRRLFEQIPCFLSGRLCALAQDEVKDSAALSNC